MNNKAFIRRLDAESDLKNRGHIIHSELRMREMSYQSIAIELGKTSAGVRNAVMDKDKSEFIQTYIADKLGVDRAVLWPRRYARKCGDAA